VITLSGEGFSSFGSVVTPLWAAPLWAKGGGAAGLAACRFLPVDAPSRACEEYDEARLRTARSPGAARERRWSFGPPR
jgi:hypothetical protein